LLGGYWPEGHQTFSLLPDFLAARLPGLLTPIEGQHHRGILGQERVEAAADALRGLDVSLPGAVRWLRRRVRAVQVLQSGADLTVIRDYLGHTSVSTTGRYITTTCK
jgi:hypothetical protein